MKRALLGTAAAWALLLVLSLCLGRYAIPPGELIESLLGTGADETATALLWNIRLPRLILVALGGGALALAGLVYQTVFSNPLVSPDVLGVASGASVGAAAAMLAFPGAYLLREGLAFGGGLAAVAFALYLAHFVRNNRILGLVLAGIVVSSASSALLMLLKFCADPQGQLPAIEYWLMGGFQNARWGDAALVAALTAAMGIALYWMRFRLKVLSLGDEAAKGLGVAPRKLRLLSVACATVLVAAVVSVAGVVSWVGLIAPHIARLLGARDVVHNFATVFLTGSALLLAADLLARTLSAAEIPVSIFTSFFGAAMLCVLLVRGALAEGAAAVNLRGEHLCFDYGGAPVLRDCALNLAGGELVFLLGVNGAGKSTLLKTLAGLLVPKSGAVFCDERMLARLPLRERARYAAYLSQNIPAADMTVAEFVLLGAAPYLSFGAVPGKTWKGRCHAVLQEMELTALAERSMAEISGGERQRAALAQVLLTGAEFLLLDEPTANLDVRRQYEFFKKLRALTAAQGKGALVSVHDPNLALRWADHIAVLSEGTLREFERTEALGENLAACLRKTYGADLRLTEKRVFDWTAEERG